MKFILPALMMFSAIAASSQDSCRIRFSGHVEDANTKEKLTVATVRLVELGREITTDDKGDFAFNGICAGNYTLLITHVECGPLQQTVNLVRDRHQDFFLPHALNTLGEVVVASRTGTASTGFRQELSGRKLEEAKGLSIGEAFSRINGVTLLQTGSTISKPIFHGLHSSRILTINNGVRQEGQQWGNEHAPELDPFIADKLTLIKGVDELKYGSDAIGGVMLMQAKPLRTGTGSNLEFNTGYFTNNRQYYASAVYEQQVKKIRGLAFRLQGTYKRGANASTPDYRLNNTASQELNFSGTMGWKTERFNTELFYSLFSTKAGIFIGSHIGNISDLEKAIAADRPSDVFLGDDSYRIGRPYQDVVHQLLKSRSQWLFHGHKLNLQIAGQYNNRKEYDIVRTSSNTRPQLNLTITTLAEDLSFEHKPVAGLTGSVGLSAMQQDNAYAGRYFIPNYKAYNYGAYWIEKWSHHDWDLQGGLRFDHKNIETNRLLTNSNALFDEYGFNFTTFAASLNAGYRVNTHWRTGLNVTRSTRAPQVNELLSNGIHHGSGTYEIGDIYLKPEKAINVNWNNTYHNLRNTVVIEADLYSNHIDDFIYQQPVPDEPVLTIAGAFPKIAYRQTDAVLNGLDLSVLLRPLTRIDWTNKASFLRARNTVADDWLILMPADRASTELTYNFPKTPDAGRVNDAYVSLEYQSVWKQSRVPSDRNGRQDYKKPPPAYGLVNLNSSATVLLGRQPVTFSVGVRNLLNNSYRDYLNSLRYFTDEMGRNVSLRIRWTLQHG